MVQHFQEFAEVVLADIVAGKGNEWSVIVTEGAEAFVAVLQGFDYGTGTQIGAANANYDHDFRLSFQTVGTILDLVKESLVSLFGQVEPAEKVVAFAVFVAKLLIGFGHEGFLLMDLFVGKKNLVTIIKSNHAVCFKGCFIILVLSYCLSGSGDTGVSISSLFVVFSFLVFFVFAVFPSFVSCSFPQSKTIPN